MPSVPAASTRGRSDLRGRVRLGGLTWRPLGRRRPTLAGLDLTVEPGERVLLVGASGAGKSTVLHALVGALGTTYAGDLSGTVEVDGRVGLLVQNPEDALVAAHVGRDVAFGPENLGLGRDETWARVDAALAAVGLDVGREHLTVALSGGEKQRLALAGQVALRPDVLLLDEPTSMLDGASAARVRDAVLSVVQDRTLVVVEHRLEPWLPHVDRVVVLGPGGVVLQDTDVPGFLAGPAPEGVWFPGLPDPEPVGVPASLVEPASSVAHTLAGVDVVLRARTLRGSQLTQALSGVDLAVRPGVVTALVGPSGSGKSTALGALGGLVRPTSGTVTPDLSRTRTRELAALVGWVPQNPEHGFVTTRVADEVARTSDRVGRPVDADAVLELLGLAHLREANPYRLSGGEQRRLALAAALAHRPGTVLLDEPTIGQDRGTWAAVAGWVRAAADAGATVALSTHDDLAPRDVEVRLEHGRVVA